MIGFGVYLSKGFDDPLRNYIVNTLSDIWKKFGIKKSLSELKLHQFLYELGRRGIVIEPKIMLKLLQKTTSYLGDHGYLIGLSFPKEKSFQDLDPQLYQFLLRLKIKRVSIEKFLPIWLAIRPYHIKTIAFDSSFQISDRDIIRIMSVLGRKTNIIRKESISSPGIQIADFIAGITHFIETFNTKIYWKSNTRIYRF